MASKIKVDQIEGQSGTSVEVPTGHTLKVTDLGNNKILSTNSTGVVTATAMGSTDQVLKMTGTNTIGFGAISGGDMVKLGQANVSNASESVFDGLFTSDYAMYKIYGYDIYSHVNNNDLQFRVNVSGSQNSDSVYNNVNWFIYTDTTPSHTINVQSSGSNDVNAPAQQWTMNFDAFSDNSGRPSFFQMTLADPLGASKYKMAEWSQYYIGSNVNIIQQGNGMGVWKNSSAISGIRIQGSAGNITGKFTLYGIKN